MTQRQCILFLFCLSWLTATGQSWKPVYRPFDSLAAICERDMDNFAYSEEIQKVCKNMYVIADRHKDKPVLKWRAMYWDAFRMWKSSQLVSAAVLARKAISMVDTMRYEYDYRRLQRLLLNCTTEEMTFFESYKAYHRLLCYFEKVGDTANIANTCVMIGNIFLELEEHNKAYDYLRRADRLYRSCGKNIHRIKNSLNLANVLSGKGRQDEAARLLKRAAKQPEVRNDTVFMLQIYASLSSCGDIGQRNGYSRKAYSLAKAYGHEGLLMQARINMGAAYINMGQGDSALLNYRKVWDYLQGHKDNSLLIPVLNGMANSFRLQEHWDSAYIYLNAALIYQDSLQKAGNLTEVYRQESRIAIDDYEAALTRQQAEARQHRFILILLLAVVVLICGFACHEFWQQRRKALIKKRLQELENKELGTRLENEELRFKLEIESKNRELVSNSLILIEKNQVLDELLQRIDNGGETGNIAKNTMLELKNQIRAHANKENEWRDFRMHFEQVHPSFFTRLKKLFPTLTEYELRLCAYIRTGMYGKQIAMMLSVQPESIKKSRSRLRKKLKLSQGDSLEDFLREINKG